MRGMDEAAKQARSVLEQNSSLRGADPSVDPAWLAALRTWMERADGNGEWDGVTDEQAVPTVVRWTEAEVLELVFKRIVPASVSSFSELHDYTDANMIGGTEFFDELTPDEEGADDAKQQRVWDQFVTMLNAVQDAVDRWIKDGGIAKDWDAAYPGQAMPQIEKKS